jgi:hypothetical protein
LNSCAVADRDGVVEIFVGATQACGDATMYSAGGSGQESFRCPVSSLDNYCEHRRVQSCDVLKCDVEGAELAVIRGAATCLRRFEPIVLLEINPTLCERAGYPPSRLLGEMHDTALYSFFAILSSGDLLPIPELSAVDRWTRYVNVLCVPNSRQVDVSPFLRAKAACPVC